ncbi:MAG: DNA methyltransferase [Planctomycetota bacterium]
MAEDRSPMGAAAVMTLKEAAKYVRVSEKTLREKARAREVPSRRVGREWRFLKRALDEWLGANQERSVAGGIVSESVGQLYLPSVETAVDSTAKAYEWGTFKDSLRAPIHGWFTYPAGFSYKAVEWSFANEQLERSDTVYDPFMGSGTTNLVAKKQGISSYGVEAHPFVFRVAKAKMDWAVRRNDVAEAMKYIRDRVLAARRRTPKDLAGRLEREFPQLILKCYRQKTLWDLLAIRNAWAAEDWHDGVGDLLFVALANLLREVSSAATGWPYIAPKKLKTSAASKDALQECFRLAEKMVADIEATVAQSAPDYELASHKLFNADSRDTTAMIPDACVDHIFTSPPYLNNFDYADRTRLELYFFGQARTWGDISRDVRTKLITSATTQIARNDPKYALSEELRHACPDEYAFLRDATTLLRKLRQTKGGKKSYDHLVSGYFNDMYKVLRDCLRVLKPGARAVFVLGDSAPYGVHIPTDELIGRIGVRLGFRDYIIRVLRARGGKWKQNPQRHSVELRESVVTLSKG